MKKLLLNLTLILVPILGFSQNAEEGCLDAPYGQYPGTTYTPSCMGVAELISGSFTGEFTKVNVTEGTEYIFSSSITNDFITISNEEGTEIYTANTTPLTWTATSTEAVRYYIHLDDECNYNTASVRNRMIQCGEIIVIEEPDFDCFQGDGITSTLEDAYNIDISTDFRTADDFIVEAGTQFTMRQITIDVNQKGVPDTAIINIREDNAGTPGEIIETITMAPTSSIAYAELYNDPVYQLTFDLPTPIEFSEGTYWLQPIMSSPIDDYVWWLTTSTGSHGAIAQRSTDDGASWYPDPAGFQMVFFVAGDCDSSQPEEPDFDCFQGDGITSSFDAGYGITATYPYKVADDFIVEAGIEFMMRQITIDVNQAQVPDNVIINIRADNAGKPGAIIETVTMAPTSSFAYAEFFGDPIYHLTFDLVTPLFFTEGTYWLQPTMTTPDAVVVYWLATSAGSTGAFPQLSIDDGASWHEDPDGLQMVFFVAGDCNSLGVSDINSFDFAFYPNPVKDVLNINSQIELKSVEVFNIIGQKVVISEQVNNGQVNVSKLTNGTYVVRATFENGQVENFKFIKK